MDLLNGNIKSLYFRYLSAAFGSALISSIYGIVDTCFIKKSGQDVSMEENVNNRLRLLYGGDYGLKVSSTKELGTEVEITLPRIVGEESRDGYEKRNFKNAGCMPR